MFLAGCTQDAGGMMDAEEAAADEGREAPSDVSGAQDRAWLDSVRVDTQELPPDGDARDATETDPRPVNCPVPGDEGPGDRTVYLAFGGLVRDYIVHVPPGYSAAAPTPLVLNMHGFGSAAWQEVLFAGTNEAADAHGFIIAYPDGLLSSWNAGSCCGTAASTGVDDVGFLWEVVRDISSRHCVDPRRVYATGMSNGGYMSHRLACEAEDLFAAVAPVAGAMGVEGCDPSRPVPVIAFHGTEDPLVPYDDGRAAVQEWVRLNGCAGAPSRESFGDSYCETWGGCRGGAEVALCTLDPMGHCWPGGSELLCLPGLGGYNDDIDAGERMWEFFERFALY